MKLNFANRITVCRILAVPVFISYVLYYTPEKDIFRYYALGIFLFAVISDIIDGYIARTRNQKTRAGAILDPLADKLLLISSYICLYKVGVNFPVFRFPMWLVVAVISRDMILLIGGFLIYILHGDFVTEATRWGKASTFFQILAVIMMLIQWPLTPVWYLALLFTVISGVDYIRKGIKIMNMTSEAVEETRGRT